VTGFESAPPSISLLIAAPAGRELYSGAVNFYGTLISGFVLHQAAGVG
jgi:hypothetical protein